MTMLCIDPVHLGAFLAGVVVGVLVLMVHRRWHAWRGDRP
jgi:hypothetical protein